MLINNEVVFHISRDDEKTNHKIIPSEILSSDGLMRKQNEIKNHNYSPLIRQSLAVTGPLMMVISAGLVTGYSATTLPQLLRNESGVSATLEEGSWIASISALPMSIGCFIGGYLMEKIGRRMLHIVMSVPGVLGWVLMACSTNIYLLLLGRFVTGTVMGILSSPSSVYIGEVTDPMYRGVFLGCISLSISIGILISHLIGTFSSWKMNAAISAIFPLICYLTMSFVPESPSWLLAKGKLKESEHAFKWLRGCGIEAIDEYEKMVEQYKKNEDNKKKLNESKIEACKKSFKKPGFVQPLVIMLVFFSTLQLSGVNAVIFYTVTILKDTLQRGFNEYAAMIIIDVIRLCMSILACVLMKKFDRRPLSLAGTGGSAAALLSLSLVLFLLSFVKNSEPFFWIPLLLLTCYIIFTSIGLVPLPWCLMGEVFPLNERGLGTGISSAWNFVLYFIVVKTGPSMFVTFGTIITFFIYGLFALAGTIFLYFRLPETKNKTLQEIENEFLRNSDVDCRNNCSNNLTVIV